MAMSWEYEVVVIGAESPGLLNLTGGQVDGGELRRQMNRLGGQGWELVTAIDTNYVNGATRQVMLLFKRPIAAAQAADE